MTAKQKSKEIFDKFNWEKTENGYKVFQTVEETKRCALIAIDLAIEYNDFHIEFLEEVKQEIEKL